MKKRRVVVLGATGSIGQSAMKVAVDLQEEMEIVGMGANRNGKLLAEQANRLRPRVLGLTEECGLKDLRARLEYDPEIVVGDTAMEELAGMEEANMVLVAIVGVAGLRPALVAIEGKKTLAVASKEILVMAGETVMEAARQQGVMVLPIDSEHNAIFQCLEGRNMEEVQRLILTASGGPFRTWERSALEEVTREQALKHPTWSMGEKISIDSATLFNKGLEMIEARWLFDVPMQKVDVIVHPQSIVHSMVEFCDGSVLAQMSYSDMCFPIQYAVTWPERRKNSLKSLDFAALGKLEFEAPRVEDFPALRLAREAGTAGGGCPAVLNAANEVAVGKFLENKLRFPEIWGCVEDILAQFDNTGCGTLEGIVAADKWAREAAETWCEKKMKQS